MFGAPGFKKSYPKGVWWLKLMMNMVIIYKLKKG
jgi:hypothetical protein